MWILLLLACTAAPERHAGRNAERIALEDKLAAQPRGITVPVAFGAAAAGDRVDVLVRDPEWRPLAQDVLVLAVDPPRVTLVLADAPAIELAGLVTEGWDISLRAPHLEPP